VISNQAKCLCKDFSDVPKVHFLLHLVKMYPT